MGNMWALTDFFTIHDVGSNDDSGMMTPSIPMLMLYTTLNARKHKGKNRHPR